MTAADAADLAREALLVTLKVGAPLLLLALVVGVAVSLFQALTQLQETTLTFVPKMAVLGVALLFLLPFMLATLTDFTHLLFDRIVAPPGQ